MRRRKLYLTLAATALAIAMARLLTRKPEPSYNGLPLSYCIRLPVHGPVDDVDKLAAAWNQMDTNALPLLVEWINYEPPAWRIWLGNQLGLTGPPGGSVVARWIWRGRREELAVGSLDAFGFLKARAEPAVDQLAQIAREHKGQRTGMRALMALAAIGTPRAAAVVASEGGGSIPLSYNRSQTPASTSKTNLQVAPAGGTNSAHAARE